MPSRRIRKQKINSSGSLVDVVVVCGGRFDMLRKCLAALEAQDTRPNVFVIDNNTDNKERLHNKEVFESPIITGSKRLTQEVGFPKSNNDGARMGKAPLLLFLNDDVELKPDAISKMVATMDNPDIGIVGAKLTFPVDSTSPIRPAGKVQHVGMALNINGDVTHPLVGWRADHPKCCVSREVVSVTGACLMVRRNLFNQVGGFWEGYGLGTYEDSDLSMSVRFTGKKIFINAEAQGTHYTGATADKKQRPFPLQQNSLMFKARWVQTGMFAWTDYKFY